jgi:hypothetical protein
MKSCLDRVPQVGPMRGPEVVARKVRSRHQRTLVKARFRPVCASELTRAVDPRMGIPSDCWLLQLTIVR